MRHDHVRRVAAVDEDAEAAHGAAQIVVAAQACRAIAAADPRIGEHALPDLDAFGIGPDGDHLADILVAERYRQLHAAVGDAQFLAAAEIEIAVGKMQVAVADAGGQHLEQHFGALGLRRRRLAERHRFAAGTDLEHTHIVPSRPCSCFGREHISQTKAE